MENKTRIVVPFLYALVIGTCNNDDKQADESKKDK